MRQIAGLTIPSQQQIAQIRANGAQFSDRLVIAKNLVVMCDLVEAMYAALLGLTQIVANQAFQARQKKRK
jgi:hypothetical protein